MRSRWRPTVAGCQQGPWRGQLDPGTGSPFAEVLDMTTGEISRHIELMRSEYDAGPIPTVSERRELLIEAAQAVEAAASELGELDALCTGKLRPHAHGTAQAGAAILRYYAGLLDADTYSAELPADQPGARQFVDRLPVGLAACILPWNFPLSQGCARLAMLFAAGCAGVFKGSELAQPPLLALAELAAEAGLPPWAFSVVTGGGEIGQVLDRVPSGRRDLLHRGDPHRHRGRPDRRAQPETGHSRAGRQDAVRRLRRRRSGRRPGGGAQRRLRLPGTGLQRRLAAACGPGGVPGVRGEVLRAGRGPEDRVPAQRGRPRLGR